MDHALRWWKPRNRSAAGANHLDRTEADEDQAQTGATTRFSDEGGDEPVLIAVINGPVEIEMAQDALQAAGIPAYIKRNSLGPLYGLSIGSFGRAEIWVLPALAEQAYNELVGIGVIPADKEASDEEAPDDES